MTIAHRLFLLALFLLALGLLALANNAEVAW